MDDRVTKEAADRKSRKVRKAKFEQVLNLIKVQDELERALAEVSAQMPPPSPARPTVPEPQQEIAELEGALGDSQAHMKRLRDEAASLRDLIGAYHNQVKQEDEVEDLEYQAQLAHSRQQRAENLRRLDEENASRLLRLAEEARAAEGHKRDANEQLARVAAERNRLARAKREAEEAAAREAERQQREVARAEVAKAIEEGESGDMSDRAWLKKLQMYGPSARTIRAKVDTANPNLLNFREKILKFTP